MRIALVSNFWYRRGGLETVMLTDARLMAERGHAVAGFAAAHPLNDPSEYQRFFPSLTDHGDVGRRMSLGAKAGAAVRLFHNAEAVRNFRAFADAFRPDLVHQHGTSRQLSPSVLAAAHKRGLPTVLTLHDYSLRCPAGTLSRPGAPVCLAVSCAGHRYDRAVRFACVHGSRAASALAAAELLVARGLRRYERSVDAFVVPSEYVGDRMREAGLPADRIHVLPNAIEAPPPVTTTMGSTMLAVGRLVSTKGMDLVVEAARLRPSVRFVIAGDGPERTALEAAGAGLANLTFAGQLDAAALEQRYQQARAVVVPSIWPEPFGMVVLEAWRHGRPVIVSARGALPEIVRHEVDGLVVEPSQPTAFVDAIDRLGADAAMAERLGDAGRERVAGTYAVDAHLRRLELLYADLGAVRS